jgi:signal transduction histidine kinase/ActR/RegA family two-component response regulator
MAQDRGLTSPESGAAAEVARLERRLARERLARREAEAIAERETLALYERTRRLELLETIATVCNLAASVEDALAETLRRLCAFTTWPLGHVCRLDDAAATPTLASSRIWWSDPAQDYRAFMAASERATFTAGVGLPGRVLATGKAAWIVDVGEDPNYPRAPMAEACGLHAAFAFPVLIGEETAAVFEFYSDKALAPDAELLRIMAQVGVHLGRTIERDRTQRLVQANNAELQRLVEEAQSQRVAAEAANRAKSSFLAVTSHEIRTPLNAVLGLAEALRREPLTPRQAELVAGVRESGAMLLRLLSAVLDLSKIEAGRMALETEAFDLAAAVETVVKVWRPRALELGLDIALNLSGLPRPCRIVSDAAKVEQTLVNLISNAVKFSPPGGEVTVRVAASSGRVRVEVADEGPGVTDEELGRIFQAYEQTEAGRAVGGAGLGLAICTGNVELLGGAIGVERREGGGAAFWFEFDGGLEAAAGAEASADGAVGTGLRVLAAEDNAANRQVLKLLLEPVGVDPVMVENGREAVAAVAERAYDVILMDANMPVMDGPTAVGLIRALPDGRGDIPIYMVTANVFADDVARYMAAGADGVIGKPIDVTKLYAALAGELPAPEGGRAAA